MSQIVSSGANVGAGGALVTTAETVLATTPVLVVPRDATQVIIIATAMILIGTATTGLSIWIRRGATTTDTQINSPVTQAGSVTPGSAFPVIRLCVDVLTGFATVQYCLTASQTGATGNGTNQGAGIAAFFIA